MTKSIDNTFRSRVGQQPTFMVPDTGSPGGTAVLVAPDETETPATKSVVSHREPDGSSKSVHGPRVGFEVPYAFPVEGEYRFVITQDDVVTEYFIEVAPAQEASS